MPPELVTEIVVTLGLSVAIALGLVFVIAAVVTAAAGGGGAWRSLTPAEWQSWDEDSRRRQADEDSRRELARDPDELFYSVHDHLQLGQPMSSDD